jgi:hypothetical protein
MQEEAFGGPGFEMQPWNPNLVAVGKPRGGQLRTINPQNIHPFSPAQEVVGGVANIFSKGKVCCRTQSFMPRAQARPTGSLT